MAKDFEYLKQQALVVKNEVEDGANSSERIGSILEGILDFNNDKLIELEQSIYNIYEAVKAIEWIQGYGLAINGTLVSNSFWETSEFIPVYPGQKISTSTTDLSGQSVKNLAYDDNKKIVGEIQSLEEYTVPEDVYYIRITNAVSNTNRDISISGGYSFTDKGEFSVLQKKVDENSTTVKESYNYKIDYTQQSNYLLNAETGQQSIYSTCNTIDYLDVSNIKIIIIDNLVCPSSPKPAMVCFYDSEKVFISSMSYSETNKIYGKQIISFPENTAYIKIGWSTNKMSEYKGKPIIYKVLDENDIINIANESINSVITDLGIFNISILDLSEETFKGNYALNENGTPSAYGACSILGYFDVSNKKYLFLKDIVCASNKTVALACFYDENKTYIEGENVSYDKKGEIYDKIIKIPTKAKYVLIGINTYNIPNLSQYHTDVLYLVDNSYIESKVNENKPYYGKRILSLGDSYTFLNYYGKYLAKVTGCTQRGRGQNGNLLRSFANDSYTGSDGNVDELFDESLLSNYDIVTIMGGTNDYGHGGTTLGSMETMEADAALGNKANTIYGAIYYLINKILTIKPSVRIYFCTQPFRLPYESNATGPGGYEENGTGLTMEKIAEAIKDVCGHFGIPVFDFYHCSGWNPWTIKFKNPDSPAAGDVIDNIYTYDGLHPKDGDGNGADLLGTAFGEFINRH